MIACLMFNEVTVFLTVQSCCRSAWWRKTHMWWMGYADADYALVMNSDSQCKQSILMHSIDSVSISLNVSYIHKIFMNRSCVTL